MESEAAYLAWLHENTNYTFHGDAPITGLTLREETCLQLGHIVIQEKEKEQARHGGRGRRKYSKPARTDKEAMREFVSKHSRGFD